MMLNIPAIEAAADLRQVYVLGSVFGGSDGRAYLEYLQEAAFFDDPQLQQQGKDLLAASEAAKRREPVPG